MLYVEKIFFCDVFQEWLQNWKSSRNQKCTRRVLKNACRDVFRFFITYNFQITLEKHEDYFFLVHKSVNITCVLTMFQFTCLMQRLDMQAIQNKLPDKTGEKNVVSDLAISVQKYPKIVTQQEIFVNQSTSIILKTKSIFISFFVVSHIFMCIKKISHQKKMVLG